MTIIGININPVLYEHVKRIADKQTEILISQQKIKSKCRILLIALKVKGKVLIYNSSVWNIFLLFILRIKGKSRLFFHLHDPIPHSGWKNPFIFIVNFISVQLAHEVLVFSKKLNLVTRKIYFKNSKILPHGFNGFKSIDVDFSDRLGVFGRNLPYKNMDVILARFKPEELVVVGKGYNLPSQSEIRHFPGFVDNDIYYSIMASVRGVIILHKHISYSGVISDAVNLKKYIIGNDLVKEHLGDYDRFIHVSHYETVDKLNQTYRIKETEIDNWSSYRENLINLW